MSAEIVIHTEYDKDGLLKSLLSTRAYTTSDLVDLFVKFLGRIWAGFTGYAEAMPEPERSPRVERPPLFVVMAPNGSIGMDETKTTLQIVAEVASDAKVEGRDYLWAIKTLRSCVDAFAHWLYKDTTMRAFGCIPGVMDWSLSQTAPRPAWQVQIEIEVTMPRAGNTVSDFL